MLPMSYQVLRPDKHAAGAGLHVAASSFSHVVGVLDPETRNLSKPILENKHLLDHFGARMPSQSRPLLSLNTMPPSTPHNVDAIAAEFL